MADARFEDGVEKPLYLGAEDAEDLRILSSLVQDAVLTGADIRWMPSKRQFALLLNRFRWEDRSAAEQSGRGVERVRAVLVFGGVLSARSQGVDRAEKDTVLSILSIDWAEGADAAGEMTITLAGDGAISLRMEAVDATLRDVTRPYLAPSGKAPHHDQ
ncbi:DUF2948 family protein [Falsirhodobacter halotolerans]|uniref:DUF2948 family protein n=1 Tax=Falsirhodobacter halotolerans TaxID=1146892 RepID=UPI001FD5B4A0|nr:DUF2948 family protein [Falsirhodobacter halotolerans]MCJ8139900.1 DUF2948 family protein [Falsirhodobacter halotolerans]